MFKSRQSGVEDDFSKQDGFLVTFGFSGFFEPYTYILYFLLAVVDTLLNGFGFLQ